MIKLGKQSNWYRPYYYDKYVIKEIKFYDKNWGSPNDIENIKNLDFE